MKFDTLLFGNGLTLSLFNVISKEYEIEKFEVFFEKFLFLEQHKKNKREFYKILNSNMNSKVYMDKNDIENAEYFLIKNIDVINKKGFEVFIGCKIFDCTEEDQDMHNYLIKDVACYYYALFNYWENLNFNNLIHNNEIQIVIENFANKLKKYNFNFIYTINFDKYLDYFFRY